jgi:hypothetical protein
MTGNNLPTEGQILAARIRAEEEAYVMARRKPYAGGWIVPRREEVYSHLSEMFGMTRHEISYFFTYSRVCSHAWSNGACHKCPVPVGY